MKTYHLTYVTTENELHTYVCDSEKSLNMGWHTVKTSVDKYAIPVYMLIKDDEYRKYYIPQHELFVQFGLSVNDKIVFLHECYEKGMISLHLYNMINYSERYRGPLSQIEKDILNNLSIRYWVRGCTIEGHPIYKVEL